MTVNGFVEHSRFCQDCSARRNPMVMETTCENRRKFKMSYRVIFDIYTRSDIRHYWSRVLPRSQPSLPTGRSFFVDRPACDPAALYSIPTRIFIQCHFFTRQLWFWRLCGNQEPARRKDPSARLHRQRGDCCFLTIPFPAAPYFAFFWTKTESFKTHSLWKISAPTLSSSS